MLHAYEKDEPAQLPRCCGPILDEADLVFIHDPQPAPLLAHCPDRRGKWIWRCHIDVSRPYRPVWKYLSNYVRRLRRQHLFLARFRPAAAASAVSHPAQHRSPERQKHGTPGRDEVQEIYTPSASIPSGRCCCRCRASTASRIRSGVIPPTGWPRNSSRPLQLVLAGGGATDDPEGEAVLERS